MTASRVPSSQPSDRDLLIIGGGPAGMAAAIEAARAGLRCTIVDEAPALGGQIYRPMPREFKAGEPITRSKDFVRGQALRAELSAVAERVEVLSGTEALGVWPGPEVLCATRDSSEVLRPSRLIIATGAYDRSVAFPGWTLPGVMTAGGVQSFLKTMRVRPGRRALVAGTGPLLLVVAKQLAESGVEVVAVLEAGRRPGLLGAVPAFWGHWGLLGDAIDYHRALRRRGIPVLYNHAVFRAEGRHGVEVADFGPLDPEDWTPRFDRARRTTVDLLAVGYGFVPNAELTTLAGCEHRYEAAVGGWVPMRDERMETSVPGVFAAGDGAGVAGVLVAVEEGRVAGIAAAEQLGALPPQEAAMLRTGPLARLRALERPRRYLDELSRIRPGLDLLAEPGTLLCRCEEVSRADVDGALAAGARDLSAVKLFTRLGMGACQGRNCSPCASLHIARVLDRPASECGRVTPRPPCKPVTLGALAESWR